MRWIFLVGDAGNNGQPWDDSSLEQGLGGSESCIVHLTRELVRIGNQVDVLGNCGNNRLNGVDWLSYKNWMPSLLSFKGDWSDTIFVSWRQPSLLVGIHGKQNWNWDHNGIGHPDPTTDQWKWISKFITLNQWHSDQYIARGAPKEKVFIGGTAIDFLPFDLVAKENLPRIPYRVVAHFHPGRGMHELRYYWETVHGALPQATLRPLWWDESVFSNFPAVSELGILPYKNAGPMDVARELSQAQVFAYPAIGTETAPLTVIEAQAAGAFPVVVPVGGMHQVSTPYVVNSNHRDFATDLIAMLKRIEDNPQASVLVRKIMVEQVRQQFNWSSVAKRWIELSEM
jgi:glycosyltransferase involved in cell wall biosynthesis